jgi:hypothetical protein
LKWRSLSKVSAKLISILSAITFTRFNLHL